MHDIKKFVLQFLWILYANETLIALVLVFAGNESLLKVG